MLFNSTPVETKSNSAVLDVGGKLQQVPIDFVWVFAGVMPPNAFL